MQSRHCATPLNLMLKIQLNKSRGLTLHRWMTMVIMSNSQSLDGAVLGHLMLKIQPNEMEQGIDSAPLDQADCEMHLVGS